MKRTGQVLPLFIFSLCCFAISRAQHCDRNQFALRYRAAQPYDCRASLVNSRNELTVLANFPYGNSTLSRFTAQGNLLWSKELTGAYVFYGAYFAHLVLDVMVAGPDDSYYLSGMINGDKPFDSNYPKNTPRGIVLQVDHFGAVAWSRMYESITEVPGLMLTPRGKLIAYGYTGDNKPEILSLDPATGGIEWVASVKSQRFSMQKGMRPAMTSFSDGNIVIADAVADSTETDLHFYSLSAADGSRVFESSYQYPGPSGTVPPQFQSIVLLPDGNLSAITSLFIGTPLQPQPVMRCLEFVLNARGEKQSVFAHYPSDGAGVNAVCVTASGANTRVVLVDHNARTNLFVLGADHRVRSANGYENATGAFYPSSVSISSLGMAIVAENLSSNESQILLTDPEGKLDCAASDVRYVSEEIPWIYDNYAVVSVFGGKDNESLAADAYGITPSEFPLQKQTDCSVLGDCCADVVDSLNTRNIVLCEGQAYKFPDGSSTADSGTYTISSVTEQGCDSVAYFHVATFKNPADLRLPADTCLGTAASMPLRATPGFSSYIWMGTADTSSVYQVATPGLYTLTVTNACGTKTDTVNVYQKCDYGIIMPNAFTPDNNGLNDIFRIPPQVKNRLISFSIYNRWGQQVFYSNQTSKGWDGRINGLSQPVGTYVYNISMEGLSGRIFSQSGSFVLIR